MEDAYIISGGKPLRGAVTLSGAKNVALKIIIASLLIQNQVVLKNVPRINDVYELLELLRSLGARADFTDTNSVAIDGTTLSQNKVDLLHGSKIRASFMLFAPLLYRFGMAYVPNPGGCRIGARPIDRIISGMTALGVDIRYDSSTGYYQAEMKRKPRGTFSFPKPSHTGTELLIMLSVFAEETITLKNTALEPEIDELISFLNESGAKINKNGSTISISPAQKLHRSTFFYIGSDRNEAVTFATLAVATKGDIRISDIAPSAIESFLKPLRLSGALVETYGTTVRVSYHKPLRAQKIETSPHPGFMTDWQPNWAVLMTQAEGDSIIHERVFENRFSYVEELRKLGAEIDFVKIPVHNPAEYFFFNFDRAKQYNQAIRIRGPQTLHNGVLTIADLRAGATLAIAALMTKGETVVNGASILERGYENFVGKIQALGGEIRKV